MERFHKFRCLPSPYRHLLVKSVLLLGLVWAALRLLPFQTLQRLLAHMMHAHAASPGRDPASMGQVIWAVTVASRYIPAATCLTQALATQVLLSRRGHAASLRIGVSRSEAGEFQAHAWVECQGRVVIGGIKALSRYTPLLVLAREGL
jgi:Transglutaminase-like superfamily